jgi:hypothetical protein
MKKPLLLFIIFAVLFIVASFAYHKYCQSKPEGCKKVKHDKSDESPRKGIDW